MRRDNVGDLWVVDAERKKAQGVTDSVDFDAVTGVVSALIADDHIGFGGKLIRQLPFSFIPELTSLD